MSNEVAIIDTDTQLGALKREAHWALVVASTGGGLTFAWLAHVLDWTPLAFAVHGVAGALGGYLVGTGIARALTGLRVRPWAKRYELVTTGNRVVASGMRVLVGAVLFYLSYLFAVGINIGTTVAFDPAMLGFIAPFGVWAVILILALGGRLIRAMR